MMMKKLVDGVILDLTEQESSDRNGLMPINDVEMLVRSDRDRLLSETDWMALKDVTMSTEMSTYRQALRDVTVQAGFPYSITWPTKP